MREKRYQQRLSDSIETYHKDKSMKIQRKYKKPYHFQILYRSESGIDIIAKDEVFVRLFDYKSAWTSNYGRIIQKLDDGTYQLVKGVYSRATKELTYTLDRNVYFKSKNRWGYRKEKVTASCLVIKMFIVNYDMKHNTMVWHKNNDTKDNYYKHLFPVTDKQYNEILRVNEQDGAITDKQIMEIVNAVEFKPDDWKPWHNKRTYEGVGYVGADTSDIDYESYSFIKWKNMIQHDNWFTIVKTAHSSKWEDMQLMAYQMNNSLPSTVQETLSRISDMSVNYLRALKKTNDETYLEYLKNKKNNFNINEVILSLVKWNPDFRKTAFFRDKKTKDISKLKNEYFKQGRLLQEGDNLTVMGNPIALLMKAVGDNPLEENIFELESDAIQCYTARFKDNERLASFRSPHNSPNNILHFHNVYSDKLSKYFANLGQNVIIINMIGTDVQARASGMDEDTDFVYTTNQPDLAELARKAYINYPTIINGVAEKGNSSYHFRLEDFAQMDNQIAAAQQSIGTSTDTAQLALSYYYDEGMDEGQDGEELKKCFVILSVIGQISIDLAKKEFDIDVVNEINRIKRLPCMRGKDIPEFFANTKKSRNNKEFEEDKIRSMNCPMDIIARNIDSRVVGRAMGVTRLPISKFLNNNIKGKENKYKWKKFIEASEVYNRSIKYIEQHKTQYTKNSYIDLKMDCMSHFLNCTNNNLDQETVMLLVKYAFSNDNSDVCNTILNFLYRYNCDKFMNCFVKKVTKNHYIFCKNIIKRRENKSF